MKLKEYIESRGIAGSRMAKILGVSPAHLNLIVNEKRRPSIKIAKKIETFTEGKISAIELLGL